MTHQNLQKYIVTGTHAAICVWALARLIMVLPQMVSWAVKLVPNPTDPK